MRIVTFACYAAPCAPPPVGTGGSSASRYKRVARMGKISSRLLSDKLLSRMLVISDGQAREVIKREMARRGIHYTRPS